MSIVSSSTSKTGSSRPSQAPPRYQNNVLDEEGRLMKDPSQFVSEDSPEDLELFTSKFQPVK